MSSPEQIIAETGSFCAPIHGESMLPLLKNHRDSVCLVPVKEYKKYDVVLFRRKNGKLVLHRIIGFKDNLLIIRGDADLVSENVYPSQCIGVMIEFCRKGKNISVASPMYRLYSRIWCSTIFFRKGYRFCRRIYLRLTRKHT